MSQKALDLISKKAEPTEIQQKILGFYEKYPDEAGRCLAIWACEYGFDELKPKKNNLEIPSDLAYYRGQKKSGQRVELDRGFWLREDINKFIDYNKFCDICNKANFEWLEKLLGWLDPERDGEYIKRIKDRMGEFKRFFNETASEVEKIGEQVEWED